MDGVNKLKPLPPALPSDVRRPGRQDGRSVVDAPAEQKRKLEEKLRQDAIDAAARKAAENQKRFEIEKAAEADAERARLDAIDAANKAILDAELEIAERKTRIVEEENRKIQLAEDERIADIKRKKEEKEEAKLARKREIERRDEMQRKYNESASAANAAEMETRRVQRDAAEKLAREAAERDAAEKVARETSTRGNAGGSEGDRINVPVISNLMTSYDLREMSNFSSNGEGIHRRNFECPRPLMTDSYKLTHPLMYPAAQDMGAYGEFRESFPGIGDDRIVYYGMRYYLTQFIMDPFLDGEIEKAENFVTGGHLTCNIKTASLPSCFDLLKIAKYFPVKIEVLPEGSVVRPHVPVYKVTASAEYSRLVTYLETMLTMTWYPSTVATLSRHTKVLIEKAFVKSVDNVTPSDQTVFRKVLNGALHDFGFRGCTCMEQSVIGGSAHLLSFTGSDTMSACYHVQYHLNGGVARGTSLAATEHSVMTSWENEIEALSNIFKNFPTATHISCVMDSYNYENALRTLLPIVRANIGNRTFVIRPDSGDAVNQVLLALRVAEEIMGFSLNNLKFKVLKNCAVIQGDGIGFKQVQAILDAVLAAGFSAVNVAFGMGGGLLQKVNRDTMSFATKLSYIDSRGVMKAPEGQEAKWSLPGRFTVLRQRLSGDGVGATYGPHVVFEEDTAEKLLETGNYVKSMVTVYDKGDPLSVEGAAYFSETFQDHIDRMEKQWAETSSDALFGAVHSGMKDRQKKFAEKIRAYVLKNRIDADSTLSLVSRDLVWRLNRVLESA